MSTRWIAPDAPAVSAMPSGRGFARQLCDVAADLPRFLVAPFVRRRHCAWGATAHEVSETMPGDDLLPRAQYRATRAVTIDAPPQDVWPWLVQVGCGRGGWYADDLLDNFARPSAERIVPEWQDLHVGQWLAMIPHPTERTAFVVDGFREPSWMLWRTPNRSWSWRLVPLPGGRTRLVTRMRTLYQWRRPLTIVTVLLMELADYAMTRRMLLGIRARAEAARPVQRRRYELAGRQNSIRWWSGRNPCDTPHNTACVRLVAPILR